jgi:hypothetical protein
MANPKLLLCKFAQDGSARKWEREETSNEASYLLIRISIDFVKRIYLDQKNSRIPKFSSKNTFVGPLLVMKITLMVEFQSRISSFLQEIRT